MALQHKIILLTLLSQSFLCIGMDKSKSELVKRKHSSSTQKTNRKPSVKEMYESGTIHNSRLRNEPNNNPCHGCECCLIPAYAAGWVAFSYLTACIISPNK